MVRSGNKYFDRDTAKTTREMVQSFSRVAVVKRPLRRGRYLKRKRACRTYAEGNGARSTAREEKMACI